MTPSPTSSDRKTPQIVRFLPGIVGALLVAVGLTFIWWPLGLIALGVFGLLVDRRLT